MRSSVRFPPSYQKLQSSRLEFKELQIRFPLKLYRVLIVVPELDPWILRIAVPQISWLPGRFSPGPQP
jgi:hypothetical protein